MIRTSPWEVSRDVKLINRDEYFAHTPEVVRGMREAFAKNNPNGRLTWGFTLNALEDKRPHYVGRGYRPDCIMGGFLSAFIAEQRKREIAVRKVLGASSGGIVYLLSGKFTQLILLALLIATPISWILTQNWLKGFEYRIAVPWSLFLYVPLLTLVVAWLTVGTESIKAASANPIKSLRSE